MRSVALLLTSGQTQVSMPSNFLKFIGIDWEQSSTRKIPLKRFNFTRDRNKGYDLRYEVIGKNIVFSGNSQPGDKNLILYYVPTATELMDGDEYDNFNGWEEYIIIDVMIKILGKEQSEDLPLLMQQKAFQLQRIEGAAANRDENEPERISIVRNKYIGIGSSINNLDNDDDC